MLKKKKIIIAKKKSLSKKPVKIAKVDNNGKKIGKITHYFSEIKVAVVKLSGLLKVGDSIRIIGGENTDFNQKVKSMQIDHKSVKMAKKGKIVGLKLNKKAREGYNIYKEII